MSVVDKHSDQDLDLYHCWICQYSLHLKHLYIYVKEILCIDLYIYCWFAFVLPDFPIVFSFFAVRVCVLVG